MRLTTSIISLIVLLGAACSPGKKESELVSNERMVTVRGKVGFPQPGDIKITEMRPQPASTTDPAAAPYEDTIKLKGNYTFEKKVRIEEPGFYQVNFYNRQFLTLMLDKADVQVNVDGNSPQGFSEIKGSPDMDLIDKVQKVIVDAQMSTDAKGLEGAYQIAAQQNNQKRVEEIQQKYWAILEGAKTEAAEIMRMEQPSLGLLQLLQNPNIIDSDKHFDVFLASAEKFRQQWPDNPHSKEFVDMVDKLKVTAIGQPAPEISLPDPTGKITTLSSFKGKYVLIDFWAKWCGPCRRENPNVVKAYNRFKSKNFDILGVSLDRTKEDWIEAIKEDGLTWNHVSDLKYFESQAARDYNITGIPFSILVDPQGVIIAKNIRGSELTKKLEEVLE